MFNDAWELAALHHAASPGQGAASNEGIKFSAIATAIEQDAQGGDDSARQLMRLFKGTHELMGFFGSLGREISPAAGGMERVADAYKGEDQDFDLGFWNIEWFSKRWQEKLDAVASIVVEMNRKIFDLRHRMRHAYLLHIEPIPPSYVLNLTSSCLRLRQTEWKPFESRILGSGLTTATR